MADERTYNIPLRKATMRKPRYRRANKAVSTVRIFLMKHLHSTDIRMGKYLNESIWKNGIKNPPHHIKVRASKDEKGIVQAELFDAPREPVKVPEKGKEAIIAKEVDKVEAGDAKPVEEKEVVAETPADTKKVEKTEESTVDVKETEEKEDVESKTETTEPAKIIDKSEDSAVVKPDAPVVKPEKTAAKDPAVKIPEEKAPVKTEKKEVPKEKAE